MTLRECFASVQSIVKNLAPELHYEAVARHLKHAQAEIMSESAVGVVKTTLTADGSRDYILSPRIGRIWKVEHEVSSIAYPVNGITPRDFDLLDQNITTTGTILECYTRFGRVLRVWPLASSGSIHVYHSPAPVMELRDSKTDAGETATGGSVTTVAASTITLGLVANRAGTTDYFNGCKVVFTSGTTLSTQASFITSTSEGASAVTFTFSPAVSIVPTTETFRIEDALEVPEEFHSACIAYAAGMSAAMDKRSGVLAERLLAQYDRKLQIAKMRGFGVGPDTEQRMKDYSEIPGYGGDTRSGY